MLRFLYQGIRRISKSNQKYFLNRSKMSIREGTERLVTTLTKSENDSKDYRLLSLSNGMRVLLISDVEHIVHLSAEEGSPEEDNDEGGEEEDEDGDEDESEENEDAGSGGGSDEDMDADAGETDKNNMKGERPAEKMAACSLCVAVGSFSDPPDIPGLAHFLEHMVFMGSEKHPKENGFDEFITRHGGMDNASTECEFTNFHFEIHEKHLREAMDRFAQFFISPLMKKEAMTRERQSIHSEFEMSLPADSARCEQMLGLLAPAGHPAGKFFWGNLKTLKEDVADEYLYEQVHEFRRRHYSAHRMTLAVQARLPLDTLEAYVTSCFSSVPNNQLPGDCFDSWKGSFGVVDTFHKLLFIESVKDVCKLHLTWVLPPYVEEYRSCPLDYVAWLVCHEGEGSLTSYLRRNVLILGCEGGNAETGFEHNSMYDLFTITFTITEDGVERIEEVVSAVFRYLAMLRTNIPSIDVYKEIESINRVNFKYKTEESPCTYVEQLSECMHVYKPEDYLCGGHLYLEYKPDVIKSVLDSLRPDNVNIILQSRNKPENLYDSVEPWFQTRYKMEGVPKAWESNWQACEPSPEFFMPAPSPYLTSDFTLLDTPADHTAYPAVIQNTELLQVWYRQDCKFKLPKANFNFYILSPCTRSTARGAALLDLLVLFLTTKFTEMTYPATISGLYSGFHAMDWGLCIQFVGFNEKLPVLMKAVLGMVQSFCNDNSDDSDKRLFEAVKKQQMRHYYNICLKPKHLTKFVRVWLLIETYWNPLQRREALAQVTLDDLRSFTAHIFKEARIKCLVQGNVSKTDALSVCANLEPLLQCKSASIPTKRFGVSKLAIGQRYIRLRSIDTVNSNSVLTNYYQAGESSFRESCIIDLLMLMMEEPLFNSLRTKQQVGYAVECQQRDTFGLLGFTITVHYQANKFRPAQVDAKVEAFLLAFRNNLQAMSPKQLADYKNALSDIKNAADLKLQDEVHRNFSEISTFDYNFDRLQRELDILPTLNKKDICDWYKEHMVGGSAFRKLSIQTVGPSKPRPKKPTKSAEKDKSKGSKQNRVKCKQDMTPRLNLLSSTQDTPDVVSNIQDFLSARQFYEHHDTQP